MTLVGIVSRNRASILPRAIESALHQANVEKSVFVFDNHSTDHTHSLKANYPSVNWIFSEENKGHISARNHLMGLDGLDFFMSLDDDAWFLEDDALAKAVLLMQSDTTIGAIAFDVISPDKPDKSGTGQLDEVADFIGCGHLLRLSAVREAGFYQPMPGFYGGEEKDLSIKLIDLGYRIIKMKGVHVWHDKTSIARDLPAQHRSGVCNDLVFFFRRSPLIILLPGLFYKIFSHSRFGVKVNLTLPTFKGIGDFLILLLLFRLDRSAVKLATIRKARKLPNA